MAKSRKRHEQRKLFPHGGKRPGAGRKPKGKRAGSPHKKRPELKKRFPVHVVLRVHDDMGSLRKRHMYRAVREATIALAKRELHWNEGGAFRIVHVSIQRTHIHLLVEADHKEALADGLKRFQISAAKHLNREVSIKRKLRVRRRGTVFPDRYHMEIITTPRQARHALAYVLNNWRKHREDRALFTRNWNVDPYSSGAYFGGWRERRGAEVMWQLPDGYQPLVVYFPKTWLLRVGWIEHGGGGLIPFDFVPSSAVPAGSKASKPATARAPRRPRRRDASQLALL